MNNTETSRRKFLKNSTLATAGALAFSRSSYASVIGANDRIRFGVIGCGGMGTGHLGSLVKRSEADNIKVLAVSDVYQRRLTRAKGIFQGDGYPDYRKLLERPDLDAVLIATPDHWHAKISIDAMDAGKHVYVEKPMTHTVEQAIRLRDAVKRTRKILQVGPNGEYPVRVNASGGLYIAKAGRGIPDTFVMTADCPSEWSLFLVSTLTNDAGIPDRIYGKHGTMELGGEPSLRFNGDFKEEFKAKNDGKEEVRLPIKQRRDLEGNFIDVLRGKDKLACNSDLGCSTMVAIKMAVESYRQKKTMLWDAKHEKVVTA